MYLLFTWCSTSVRDFPTQVSAGQILNTSSRGEEQPRKRAAGPRFCLFEWRCVLSRIKIVQLDDNRSVEKMVHASVLWALCRFSPPTGTQTLSTSTGCLRTSMPCTMGGRVHCAKLTTPPTTFPGMNPLLRPPLPPAHRPSPPDHTGVSSFTRVSWLDFWGCMMSLFKLKRGGGGQPVQLSRHRACRTRVRLRTTLLAARGHVLQIN